jgi:hypothetical protein
VALATTRPSDHPTRLPLVEDDVVQGIELARLAVRTLQMRAHQRPAVDAAATLECRIDGAEHVLRAHVGEKAESTAVDAEQGDVMLRDESCCVE